MPRRNVDGLPPWRKLAPLVRVIVLSWKRGGVWLRSLGLRATSARSWLRSISGHLQPVGLRLRQIDERLKPVYSCQRSASIRSRSIQSTPRSRLTVVRPRFKTLALSAVTVVMLIPPVVVVARYSDESVPVPRQPTASITIQPTNHAKEIDLTAPVRVSATQGTLTEVTVADFRGRPLKGTLNAERMIWSSTGALTFNTTYRVTAKAVDQHGLPTTATATFTTVTPDKLLKTSVAPLHGETVGVGQPIDVKFSQSVKDRAAVERGLKVSATPVVAGSWHWFDSRNAQYRPRKFWPAGTKVTLRIGLTGVKAGPGLYGAENRVISFTIGRSMVSVVDVTTHTMTVYRDGKLIRTIPVTSGSPEYATRNGPKVVLFKEKSRLMDSSTVGIPEGHPEYYRLNVDYAVRLTNSGEFVHAADWSAAAHGRINVSHGCIGMNTSDAQWFYDNAIRGDVVEVQNSPRKVADFRNGYLGWNMSWSQWRAGSALR